MPIPIIAYVISAITVLLVIMALVRFLIMLTEQQDRQNTRLFTGDEGYVNANNVVSLANGAVLTILWYTLKKRKQ